MSRLQNIRDSLISSLQKYGEHRDEQKKQLLANRIDELGQLYNLEANASGIDTSIDAEISDVNDAIAQIRNERKEKALASSGAGSTTRKIVDFISPDLKRDSEQNTLTEIERASQMSNMELIKEEAMKNERERIKEERLDDIERQREMKLTGSNSKKDNPLSWSNLMFGSPDKVFKNDKSKKNSKSKKNDPLSFSNMLFGNPDKVFAKKKKVVRKNTKPKRKFPKKTTKGKKK